VEQIRVNPGALIVFEGLDKAGKSTQVDLLRSRIIPGTAAFPHMPSGETAFTQGVYHLLDDYPPQTGLAKQLAHLACHCENVPAILEALRTQGVVLDRWWWSTMAYGWYSGDVLQAGLSEAAFRELIRTIWEPLIASVVVLFLSAREDDPNNASGVEGGSRKLAETQSAPVLFVPDLSVDDTHEFLVEELRAADLAHRE
jgi:dTMP kinase